MNNGSELSTINKNKKSFIKQLSKYHIKFLTSDEQKLCKLYGLNDGIPFMLCFTKSFKTNIEYVKNNNNAMIYLCYGNNIFGYKLIGTRLFAILFLLCYPE